MPVLAGFESRGERVNGMAINAVLRSTSTRVLAAAMAATGTDLAELSAENVADGIVRLAAADAMAVRSGELAMESGSVPYAGWRRWPPRRCWIRRRGSNRGRGDRCRRRRGEVCRGRGRGCPLGSAGRENGIVIEVRAAIAGGGTKYTFRPMPLRLTTLYARFRMRQELARSRIAHVRATGLRTPS